MRISDWRSDVCSADLHKGEEAGFLVSGQMTLWLDGKEISLRSGDSFAFESTIPHRSANESDEAAVIIWALSPPSRSAESRVGNECVSTCRSRCWPSHSNNKRKPPQIYNLAAQT